MTRADTLNFLIKEKLIHRDWVGPYMLLVSDIDPTRWVRFWPDTSLVCYGSWPPIPSRFDEVLQYLMTGHFPWSDT